MHSQIVNSRESLVTHVARKFLLLVSSRIAARVDEMPFEVILSREGFVARRALDRPLRWLLNNCLLAFLVRLSRLFLL